MAQIEAPLDCVDQYVLSHYPERAASKRLAKRLGVNKRIPDWIMRALAQQELPAGSALELGCGPGAYGVVWSRFCAFTILADIRPPFAHMAALQGAAIVCDAHNPPFRAESMALVAAINLLDDTPEPWLLLGQIDALLKPGGICVLALPYAANFSGPAELLATLRGMRSELPHLSYTVLASNEWLPWVVPAGERLVHEYQVHAVIARKAMPSARGRMRGPRSR
jgi:SAM-dependent methyltransferase